MLYENLTQAKDIYVKAKNLYYNTGNSFLSDFEFDTLVEYIKNQDPTFIDYVGSSNKENKYTHRSPMLSLPKVQMSKLPDGSPDYSKFKDDLLKYDFLKYNTIEITPKFDGVSVNIQYDSNGNLVRAITRGDKEKGKDITSKIRHAILPQIGARMIRSNVEGYDISFELRGEVLMKLETFNNKYSSTFKNPRNLVSGILSNKDDVEMYADLDVIIFEMRVYIDNKLAEIVNTSYMSKNQVYQIIKESNAVQDSIYIIDGLDSVSIPDVTTHIYETMNNVRTSGKCLYQLDGFVIKVSDSNLKLLLGENDVHPKWAVACKFIPQVNTTGIINIEWKMGKSGKYCPIAELSPIDLDGSVVKHATLHNYGMVKNGGLSIGAKVSIEKKGDIIPQIAEVLQKSSIEFSHPTHCVNCGERLEIINDIHLACTNLKCEGIRKLKFRSACTTMKFDFLGGKTADKLFDSGLVSDIFDCFDQNKMTYENLVNVAGFADGKIANRLILEFNNKRVFNVSDVIQLLEIDNVGKRFSEQLGKYLVGEEDFTGLEKEIVESFKNGKYKEILEDALLRLENYQVEVLYPSKENNDNYFIYEMTGSPKSENVDFKVKSDFIDYALQFGFKHGKLKKGVTKYLITDSYDSTSSKMQAARKNNIEIITYNDFVNLYK